MGSAASQPQPLSEKSCTYSPATPREPTAADLLAALSLSNGKAPASPAVTTDNVAAWADAFDKNPKNKFAQTVVHKQDFLSALVSRQTLVNDQQGEWWEWESVSQSLAEQVLLSSLFAFDRLPLARPSPFPPSIHLSSLSASSSSLFNAPLSSFPKSARYPTLSLQRQDPRREPSRRQPEILRSLLALRHDQCGPPRCYAKV